MGTIKPIHPFPARMAPDLAIAGLKELSTGSLVLDPMVGSGTVVRQATALGHKALGFDSDPLAVLMAKVWNTPAEDAIIEKIGNDALARAKELHDVTLPWIDEDTETSKFIDYWFAEPQRDDLRRLAFVLSQLNQSRLQPKQRPAVDAIVLALSRIIITKDQGASLARDASHSRPHKVAESSNFDVFTAFDRSLRQIRKLLKESPPIGNVTIRIGDARHLTEVENKSIDAALTSPPYLNAIDYMRGHRLSLAWLGYRISELRTIRSNSIGAERGPDLGQTANLFEQIEAAMTRLEVLPRRHSAMVKRYAEDVYRLMSEIARVLKPAGKAIVVVGNSCLKGVFIRNSEGVARAASMVGLKLLSSAERELPTRSRYLPIPADMNDPLGKRMRTETILTFIPA